MFYSLLIVLSVMPDYEELYWNEHKQWVLQEFSAYQIEVVNRQWISTQWMDSTHSRFVIYRQEPTEPWPHTSSLRLVCLLVTHSAPLL